MSNLIEIVDELLEADLCHKCLHVHTCEYPEALKKALKGHQLEMASETRYAADVCCKQSRISPGLKKLLKEHPPGTPTVAIIRCHKRKIVAK